MGIIHAAREGKSKRLQKVLSVLADHRPHSTWQIAQRTQSVAVHTDIAELRANGHTIETALRGCTSEGKRIYTYRLVRRVEELAHA